MAGAGLEMVTRQLREGQTPWLLAWVRLWETGRLEPPH